MLTGQPPFEGHTDEELMDRILDGKIAYGDETWCDISEDAKLFVQSMLTYDYK